MLHLFSIWLVATLTSFTESMLLGYLSFFKQFQHGPSVITKTVWSSLCERLAIQYMKPWHTHTQSDSLLWLIFTGVVLCKHTVRTWDVDSAACTKLKWEKCPGYRALDDEPVFTARDARRVIIISTSCEGTTLDFQESGITPCAYLCFFF